MDTESHTSYDIRGNETAPLTTDYTWNIGKAMADWLPTDGHVLVATHQDQTQVANACIEGLRLQGRAVISAGQLSKEQVTERITTDRLSGAVIIAYDELEHTATIEIYDHEGHLLTSDTGLTDLTNNAQAGNFVPAAVKGELTSLA